MQTMTRHLALIITAVLASVMALANAQAQTDYAAIEANPALWSISDEDSTVYLFGTVHLLPPQLVWKTPAVEAALNDADWVYLETDAYSAEAQAEMAALIPQLGLNEPGVMLSGLISDEAKTDLARYATSLGLPPQALLTQVEPLKPWLASLTLALTHIQSQGYDPQSGVESKIVQSAGDKSFGYFETVEQQLRFFADMPLDVQVSDFEVSVREIVEDPEFLTELVQAWASGDMDEVDQMFNDTMREDSPESFQAIIVDRNIAWTPQIVNVLAGSEDAFIAVGAGHMPGDHGVIALLEAQGLTVTRLN